MVAMCRTSPYSTRIQEHALLLLPWRSPVARRLRSSLGVTFIAAMIAAVAYGQVAGSVAGVISGPGGPLQGLTVNVVNAAGQVVGTATTAADGSYTVGN